MAVRGVRASECFTRLYPGISGSPFAMRAHFLVFCFAHQSRSLAERLASLLCHPSVTSSRCSLSLSLSLSLASWSSYKIHPHPHSSPRPPPSPSSHTETIRWSQRAPPRFPSVASPSHARARRRALGVAQCRMQRLDCRLFEAGIFIDTLKGAAHVKLEVHTKSELETHRALGWRGKGARKRQMNTT
jgi:hypothetical protein